MGGGVFPKTTAKAVTLAIAAVTALTLAACQSGNTGPGTLALSTDKKALAAMEVVFKSAQACWFASKDSAFKPYRIANELNSFTGRPRFLLVPARNPSGRPLLVVQASGKPARIEAFGPMMAQSVGNRITADIRRWTSGNVSCGTAA